MLEKKLTSSDDKPGLVSRRGTVLTKTAAGTYVIFLDERGDVVEISRTAKVFVIPAEMTFPQTAVAVPADQLNFAWKEVNFAETLPSIEVS